MRAAQLIQHRDTEGTERMCGVGLCVVAVFPESLCSLCLCGEIHGATIYVRRNVGTQSSALRKKVEAHFGSDADGGKRVVKVPLLFSSARRGQERRKLVPG